MFCDQCGANLEPGMAFCRTCGKPQGAAGASPGRGSMAGHFRALGIIWIIVSALRMLPGAILYMLARNGMQFLPPEVPLFVHGLIRIAALFLLAGGAIGIVTGWGLLTRQPWARMLAIVLGVLNLLDIPIGTALGIYTLWALLPAASAQEYGHAAQTARG